MMDEEATKRYVRMDEDAQKQAELQRGGKVQEDGRITVLPRRKTQEGQEDAETIKTSGSDSSSSSCCASCLHLKDRCPRPRGLINLLITKVCLFALLFGVVWSITGSECLPGGNLFGIVILFICSVLGGKLVGMIRLPTLPPFPPLLGMLLAGLLLRNIPYITDAVFINTHWSAALRNIALAIILTRAGLGLNPSLFRTFSLFQSGLMFIQMLTAASADISMVFREPEVVPSAMTLPNVAD
ncbi:sodium/hydrogen exchanger 9B2 [Pholidichthys leucotaenia]